MFDNIAQIWIIIFGATAVRLVASLGKYKKWGYISGLLSQPAWFYTTYKSGQWGIMILCCWYTYSWAQGAYNYWIIEPRKISTKS